MCVSLVLLAKGTALNIAADQGSETRPPKLSGDQLARFQEAGVASQFVIMAARKNGVAKGVVRGDVDTAFVGKDAGIDLPVGQLRTEGKGNVFMHGLEGLKNEGVARGGGFNSMREGSVD